MQNSDAVPPQLHNGEAVKLLIDELTACSCSDLEEERISNVFMACQDLCDSEEAKALLISHGWVENSLVVMKRLVDNLELLDSAWEILDGAWEVLYFCAFEIVEEFGSKREGGGAEIILHVGKAAARILRRMSEKGLWAPGLSCNIASLLYALWLEDGFQGYIKKAFANTNGESALGVLVRDVRNDEEIEVEVVSLVDGLLKGGALATSGGGDVERAIVGELAAKMQKYKTNAELVETAASVIRGLMKRKVEERKSPEVKGQEAAKQQAVAPKPPKPPQQDAPKASKTPQASPTPKASAQKPSPLPSTPPISSSPPKSSPIQLSPSAMWSRNISQSCILRHLGFSPNRKEGGAHRSEEVEDLVERGKTTLGITFLRMGGDSKRAIHKSRLRKFLKVAGLCPQLAGADLIIKRVNGARSGVDFESYCEILMQCKGNGGVKLVVDALTDLIKRGGEKELLKKQMEEEQKQEEEERKRLMAAEEAEKKRKEEEEERKRAGEPMKAHKQPKRPLTKQEFFVAVLHTERRALKAIFKFYSTEKEEGTLSSPRKQTCPQSPGTSCQKRVITYLSYKGLLEFTRDFCVSPDLVSKAYCQEVFSRLCNGRKGAKKQLVRRDSVLLAEKKLGLSYPEFEVLLGSIAAECRWFLKKKDEEAELDEEDRKKVYQQQALALLHWLETSRGKDKINRVPRGNALIPRFIFVSKVENVERLSNFFISS